MNKNFFYKFYFILCIETFIPMHTTEGTFKGLKENTTWVYNKAKKLLLTDILLTVCAFSDQNVLLHAPLNLSNLTPKQLRDLLTPKITNPGTPAEKIIYPKFLPIYKTIDFSNTEVPVDTFECLLKTFYLCNKGEMKRKYL